MKRLGEAIEQERRAVERMSEAIDLQRELVERHSASGDKRAGMFVLGRIVGLLLGATLGKAAGLKR